MLSEIQKQVKPEVDLERWQRLKERLINEISRGRTLEEIANIVGERIFARNLEDWMEDPGWMREGSYTRFGVEAVSVRIETALEKHFDDLDRERGDFLKHPPKGIETSVMKAVLEGFRKARTIPAMVDICVPSGAGKTEAKEEYLARCRKEEGLKCPVWTIELSEFGLTIRDTLEKIVRRIGADHQGFKTEAEIDHFIEENTRGRRGLLIIDEAQHLADAKIDHGVRIINGLRRYVDKRLFGIALLNNGEIYRRISGGKQKHFDQLFSRMKGWRIEVPGVTENDVDLVMAAWKVSGKDERAWCIRNGMGPGQLRSIVTGFQNSLYEFREINIDTLER